ncbi:putative transposase [Escherichia coli]|nr:putative transposase [Escherichia coli]
MDKPTDWRSGTRRIFSNEFKLHMVELASKPNANWICPYISRHLLSLNPSLAHCRRYSRGER